jgi:hypothetical protein
MIIGLIGDADDCDEVLWQLAIKRGFHSIKASDDLVNKIKDATSYDESRWFTENQVRIVVSGIKTQEHLNILLQFQALIVQIGQSEFDSNLYFAGGVDMWAAKGIALSVCGNMSKRRKFAEPYDTIFAIVMFCGLFLMVVVFAMIPKFNQISDLIESNYVN